MQEIMKLRDCEEIGSQQTAEKHFGSTYKNSGASLLQEGLSAGIFKITPNASDFLNGFQLNLNRIGKKSEADERAEFVRKPENRGPADVGSLWDKDSRVLQIGDSHRFNSVKNWTADNMPEFAKQGAQAFAMEFLPQSMQKSLDDYAKLRANGSAQDIETARGRLFETM